MPTIKFKDGTKKEVGYDKAARINLVFTGVKKPENKEQEALVGNIESISFHVKPKELHERTDSERVERAKKIYKVVNNDKLTGREKAQKVGKILKGKNE